MLNHSKFTSPNIEKRFDPPIPVDMPHRKSNKTLGRRIKVEQSCGLWQWGGQDVLVDTIGEIETHTYTHKQTNKQTNAQNGRHGRILEGEDCVSCTFYRVGGVLVFCFTHSHTQNLHTLEGRGVELSTIAGEYIWSARARTSRGTGGEAED